MILTANVSAPQTWEGIGDESVQTVCTSPPYWGLRDYGVTGQLGLEKTPEEYVENMFKVFRFVRQKLRKDGTVWLNLGDTYAADRGGTPMPAETLAGGVSGRGDKAAKRGRESGYLPHRDPASHGLKHKDLCGIPWRVAFALQADGWWLRSDIIWSKPNPMPESVTDRPTKAHEYIFLLTKSAKYYYDAQAIAEPLSYTSVERLSQPNLENQAGSDRVPGKTNGRMKAVYRESYTGKSKKDYDNGGAQDASATKARIVDRILAGEIVSRNRRSVWEVTTHPFPGAHFATFPERIPELCIKAGTSEKGCCVKCGSPVERVTENVGSNKANESEIKRYESLGVPRTTANLYATKERGTTKTIGWQPTCTCNAGTKPCLVLDPFAGSGTTGEVALRLGRKFVGIELNEKYVKELIEPRLENVNPLFNH